MSIYFLLAASVVSYTLSCGILRNDFSKKEAKNGSDLQVFNAVTGMVSAVVLVIYAGCSGTLTLPSLYTLGWSAAYGVVTALQAIFHIKALESGPLSYTTVMIACSMVIPALSGLFFGEAVTPWQYAGIGLMMIFFACAIDTKDKSRGTSVKWFVYCMLSFVCCGAVGVIQKIHQSNAAHKNELSAFLVLAFLMSTVFSLMMWGYCSKTKQQKTSLFQKGKIKKLVIVGIVSGVGIAFCNQVNMFLSGVMDSIIFFPVVNGGSMILTSCAGLFLYKEKLSLKQWIGLAFGVGAILLLCNVTQ